MEMGMKEDGTKYAIYPFEFDGYKFISRVLVDSDLYKKVSNVPEHYFALMNEQCLQELVGTGLNLEQVKAKLYEINRGAGHAYIELADEL